MAGLGSASAGPRVPLGLRFPDGRGREMGSTSQCQIAAWSCRLASIPPKWRQGSGYSILSIKLLGHSSFDDLLPVRLAAAPTFPGRRVSVSSASSLMRLFSHCDSRCPDEYGASPECKEGETGDPLENPPTSAIVRHDSHMREFWGNPARSRTSFALVGGSSLNHRTTAAPKWRGTWLACSPSTKVKRGSLPDRVTPDFHMWALMTALSRAAQISSLNHSFTPIGVEDIGCYGGRLGRPPNGVQSSSRKFFNEKPSNVSESGLLTNSIQETAGTLSAALVHRLSRLALTPHRTPLARALRPRNRGECSLKVGVGAIRLGEKGPKNRAGVGRSARPDLRQLQQDEEPRVFGKTEQAVNSAGNCQQHQAKSSPPLPQGNWNLNSISAGRSLSTSWPSRGSLQADHWGGCGEIWVAHDIEHSGKRETPKKPADQRHRPERFPHVKVRFAMLGGDGSMVVAMEKVLNHCKYITTTEKLRIQWWLREALRTDLVSDWLLRAAKCSLLAGLSAGEEFEIASASSHHLRGYGDCAVGLLACHQGEQGFACGNRALTMPLVGGFPRGSLVTQRSFIPALLHTHLTSPSSHLKTSLLTTTQISSLAPLPLICDGFRDAILRSLEGSVIEEPMQLISELVDRVSDPSPSASWGATALGVVSELTARSSLIILWTKLEAHRDACPPSIGHGHVSLVVRIVARKTSPRGKGGPDSLYAAFHRPLPINRGVTCETVSIWCTRCVGEAALLGRNTSTSLAVGRWRCPPTNYRACSAACDGAGRTTVAPPPRAVTNTPPLPPLSLLTPSPVTGSAVTLLLHPSTFLHFISLYYQLLQFPAVE
ncbi:hypothetical protein PR048_003376 [Dryococelus australis]|uniref:Uncharacterized protein n=1 Tax=Dryococelus australis TaxID=614101 RepID=A0ABQ9IMY1_9NEOP|nr:hypothetical protein PR048_003376 [Dryococelus australis]